MKPEEAQILLLNRRIDALEKQVGDAINGLMMLSQALQFWSNDQHYQEQSDPDLDDAVAEFERRADP